MNEFKGTQGQWKVKHSKSKAAFNVVGSELGGKYKIARFPYFQDARLSEEFNNKEIDEAKANAQLCTSSKDLLGACISAKAIFDSQGINENHSIVGEQYKSLINAIDKALGNV